MTRDRQGFVQYRRISVGTQNLFMGYSTCEDVIGVGSYQLKLCSGRTLNLHDVFYAHGVPCSLFSSYDLILLSLSGNMLNFFFDSNSFGHG